jgi:hypothetical protein
MELERHRKDVPLLIEPPQKPVKEAKAGIVDKVTGGIEAILNMTASGIASPIANALGLGKSVLEGGYGTAKGAQNAEKYAGEFQQGIESGFPKLSPKGQEYSQSLADFLSKTGIAGVAPLAELHTLGAAVRPAAQVLKATPEAGAIQAISKAGGKAGLKPFQLSQDKLALKQRADEVGINLSPHHFADNKLVKTLGEIMQDIPASGSSKLTNRVAIQKALIKEIGGDFNEKELTPRVFKNAKMQSGKVIEDTVNKYDLRVTPGLVNKVTAIIDEASTLSRDDAAALKNTIGHLNKVAKGSRGRISGPDFRVFNTRLNRSIDATFNRPDLRNALSDVQDTLLSAYRDSITKDLDRTNFDIARRQYAIAKDIEPIVHDVHGVKPGDIKGALRSTKEGKARYAAGESGSMGQLAEIGQLLEDPNLASALQRHLIYSGLGGALGVGQFFNPATAGAALPAGAALYGLSNLYNRLGSNLIASTPKPKGE